MMFGHLRPAASRPVVHDLRERRIVRAVASSMHSLRQRAAILQV
jgi:hypothetical protein